MRVRESARPGCSQHRRPQRAREIKFAFDLGRVGRITSSYRTVSPRAFKALLDDRTALEAIIEERLRVLDDVLPIRFITPGALAPQEGKAASYRSAAQKASEDRYSRSLKGRARHARYNVSTAGARRAVKYNSTAKGRARIDRFEATPRRQAYKAGRWALGRSPYRVDPSDLAAARFCRPHLLDVPLEPFLTAATKRVRYQEPVPGWPGMMRPKTRLVPIREPVL